MNMKKVIILSFVVFFPVFMNAQIASSLIVHDTRWVKDTVSHYKTSLRLDFKHLSACDVPYLPTAPYSANLTVSPWLDETGGAVHQVNFNSDGLWYRQGHFEENDWREWRKLMLVNTDGSISGKLEVNGFIRAQEVKIENTNWPDYVFDKDYHLPSLSEVAKHIELNKHLPGIPSAREVEESGINLSEMNAKLLQKIEEMTLYMLQQQQAIETLQREVDCLKKNN